MARLLPDHGIPVVPELPGFDPAAFALRLAAEFGDGKPWGLYDLGRVLGMRCERVARLCEQLAWHGWVQGDVEVDPQVVDGVDELSRGIIITEPEGFRVLRGLAVTRRQGD